MEGTRTTPVEEAERLLVTAGSITSHSGLELDVEDVAYAHLEGGDNLSHCTLIIRRGADEERVALSRQHSRPPEFRAARGLEVALLDVDAYHSPATATIHLRGATTGPDEGDECRADDDCRLSTLSRETCCSRCGESALTLAEHEDLNRYCAEHSSGDCPSLDCPYEPSHAACNGGQCVRVAE